MSFSYSTVDGSALAGSDYTAKSGTVTIAVGQQSVFVSIDVRGDLGIEGSEQFSLAVVPVDLRHRRHDRHRHRSRRRCRHARDQPVRRQRGRGCGQHPLHQLRHHPVGAISRHGPGQLPDHRRHGLAGIDYQEDFGTVTFAAGRTSRTVQIRVWGDTADELDEHIALELYGPTGGAVFSGGVPTLRATGVILDDDGTGSDRALLVSDVRLVEGDAGIRQAVFEIRLSGPAATAMSFTYSTVDGSAWPAATTPPKAAR